MIASRHIITYQEDPTTILLVCMVVLSVGRVAAMHTTSLVTVYAVMGLVIVGLGVINTEMAAAVAKITASNQVD